MGCHPSLADCRPFRALVTLRSHCLPATQLPISSPRHHVTTPKRHHVTTSPRHHVTSSPRHHVTTPKRHHVTTSPRHHVTTSPRHHVTTSPRHHAKTPPRQSDKMSLPLCKAKRRSRCLPAPHLPISSPRHHVKATRCRFHYAKRSGAAVVSQLRITYLVTSHSSPVTLCSLFTDHCSL